MTTKLTMRVHEGLLQNTNINIDTCHHDHNSRGSVNGLHTNNTICDALQKEYRRHNLCAASNDTTTVRAMHDGGWGLHLHIVFIV